MTIATLAVLCTPAEARKHHTKHRCDGLKGKAHWGCIHRWHRKPSSGPLRPALASWYGPADSGGSLACTGETLTSSTMGVANKTLPCGTRVRVCLNGCVDVRVVDRGPYVEGREYDLTEATARQIGFLSVGVGTIYVGVGG